MSFFTQNPKITGFPNGDPVSRMGDPVSRKVVFKNILIREDLFPTVHMYFWGSYQQYKNKDIPLCLVQAFSYKESSSSLKGFIFISWD